MRVSFFRARARERGSARRKESGKLLIAGCVNVGARVVLKNWLLSLFFFRYREDHGDGRMRAARRSCLDKDAFVHENEFTFCWLQYGEGRSNGKMCRRREDSCRMT